MDIIINACFSADVKLLDSLFLYPIYLSHISLLLAFEVKTMNWNTSLVVFLNFNRNLRMNFI